MQHDVRHPSRATAAQAQTATAELDEEQDLGNAFAQEQLRAKPASAVAASAAESAQGPYELLGQRFGSLQEVHDWLVAESQRPGSTVPYEPVLEITIAKGSTIRQREQTDWTYYNPDQKLVIDGQGSTVSGRRDGKPTEGWFLSYRPTVESTQEDPAPANFEMRGLTIRGYESGGVELSPQSTPGEAHQDDGGLNAFIEGAIIEDNRFEDLGSKDTPYAQTSWAKGRFGAAGVLMRGVSGATISNNVFEGLENGAVRGTPTGPRLIHAVYARDRSCDNRIEDNVFRDISGDPVRVSNASNDNVVTGNRARNAGLRTLVSEFYNSGPERKELDSTGNRVYGNDLGRAYGKTTKISRFHEKHVTGG